jgi:hypothetical protein
MVTTVEAADLVRKKLASSNYGVGDVFLLADLFSKQEWEALTPTTFGRLVARAWTDGLLPELHKHPRNDENHTPYEVLSR